MSATPTDTDAPSSSTREPEILDSPIEELSPAEKNLVSLRDKLNAQIKDLADRLENGSHKLSAIRSRIQELETNIVPELEIRMMKTSNDAAEAKGAFAGLEKIKGILRDKKSETSIVRSLEAGVAEHKKRARTFAVELIGEHADLIAEFLNNPALSQYRRLHSINQRGIDVVYGDKGGEIVDDKGRGIDEAQQDVLFIDESRATGLPFEIKNKLRPAVSSAFAAWKKAIDEHGYKSRERIETEANYQSAQEELRQAILREHGLLAESSRELRLAEGLRDSIEKIDQTAAQLEKDMKELADENVKNAEAERKKISIDYQSANDELRRKREEIPGWKLTIDIWKRSQEKTNELLSQTSDAEKTLERAEELLANVNKLQGEISAAERNIHDHRTEAQSGDVRGMFKVDESIQRDIDEAVGKWKGVTISAHDNLERALARLKFLYENLTFAIENANSASAETHSQLNTEACERVVEAGRFLQRFLDDEWTQLDAGSEDKIAAIRDKARAELEAVLRPQMALNMLGEILKAAQNASAGAQRIIGKGDTAIGTEAWEVFHTAMETAETHAENPDAGALLLQKVAEAAAPEAPAPAAASAEPTGPEQTPPAAEEPREEPAEAAAAPAPTAEPPPATPAAAASTSAADATEKPRDEGDLPREGTRVGQAPTAPHPNVTSSSPQPPRRRRGADVEE